MGSTSLTECATAQYSTLIRSEWLSLFHSYAFITYYYTYPLPLSLMYIFYNMLKHVPVSSLHITYDYAYYSFQKYLNLDMTSFHLPPMHPAPTSTPLDALHNSSKQSR